MLLRSEEGLPESGWQNKVANMKSMFAAIVALSWTSQLIASPILDLASPLQATRDTAAKILRTSYLPPDRKKSEAVVAQIKAGDSMTGVLNLIRDYNPKTYQEAGPTVTDGNTGTMSYRLDDLWLLQCDFEFENASEKKLIDSKIIQDMRTVLVDPPVKFNGTWITYFVNGQKSQEVEYQDGNYSGEFIAYYSDGSKRYLKHFDRKNDETEGVGYFPSGHIAYRGQGKGSKNVGIWIWYNEDGSTNFVTDYSKP
jgi:hypothetical protein